MIGLVRDALATKALHHVPITQFDHHILLLLDGKTRADLDHALEWLEKAGGGGSAEEDAELWYARGLACLRVDHGRGEDGTSSSFISFECTCAISHYLHPPYVIFTLLTCHLPQPTTKPNSPTSLPSHFIILELTTDDEGWTEEIETETYGAKTGLEFIRVVRRRANKHKKARGKEEEKAKKRKDGGGGDPSSLDLAFSSSVHPRHRRALRRFIQAAAWGHVAAMIQTGNLLYENVQDDEEKEKGNKKTLLQQAVEWYTRAANAEEGEQGGHPDAWYNLGTIFYEGGPGVER